MRILTASLCALILMAQAASAKTYLCQMAPGGDVGGYITEVYAFDVNEKTQKVVVDDGVIEYFNNGPLEAFSAKITAAKITFNWDVKAVNGSGQRTKLSFRAALFMADMRLRISMRPIGYTNDYEAYGKCRAK